MAEDFGIGREAREQMRDARAKIADASQIAPKDFPGDRGIYMANLEGFLGTRTILILDALEKAEAALATERDKRGEAEAERDADRERRLAAQSALHFHTDRAHAQEAMRKSSEAALVRERERVEGELTKAIDRLRAVRSHEVHNASVILRHGVASELEEIRAALTPSSEVRGG